MSIATQIQRLQQAKADIKSAIENKGVTVPSGAKYDTYDTYISQIPTTVLPVEKAVNFYDYDGSVVASYTASEFANLTSLPANPTHAGLTAQGWNFTLADAKAYVASYGRLCVGQMYATTSGATEIDFTTSSANQYVVIAVAVNGTITIDWGDSTTTSVTGTSYTSKIEKGHTYTSSGSHTISILETTGEYRLYKNSETNNGAFFSRVTAVRCGAGMSVIAGGSFIGCTAMEYLTLPSNVTEIQNAAIDGCVALRHLTVPKNVTLIGQYGIRGCSSMSHLSLPNSVTDVGDAAFYGNYNLKEIMLQANMASGTNLTTWASVMSECKALRNVIIPEGFTNIGNSLLSGCQGLASITIPSTVTSVSSLAFSLCTGMDYYIFLSTTPPSLANVSAFNNIPVGAKIYVPANSVTAYQTATNWSSLSSHIMANPF